MTFCCFMYGLSSAASGMFLRISWRCVVNVDSDMRMMSTAVRILTLRSFDPTKVEDSCAPKIVDFSMTEATPGVIGPMGACAPVATCGRLLSTWNNAKKNGDCSRIGRHEENGLEPVLL